MTHPNFDRIAPFYDSLVKVVFGEKLWNAQKIHLKEIRLSDRVLVLGGGSGKILGSLVENTNVTYLDLSEKMIDKAKRKGQANFVVGDFILYEFETQYDVIICSFFLDCFDEENLNKVIGKIDEILSHDGSLIVTDFKARTCLQKLHVKAMILFFKVFAKLPITKLLPLQGILRTNGFNSQKSREFANGFIFSDIYKKTETF